MLTTNPNPNVRCMAIATLRPVLKDREARHEVYERGLNDPDSEVRGQALRHYFHWSSDLLPSVSEAMSLLPPLLQDTNPKTRFSAIGAIELYGAEARAFVPLLEKLTNSEDSLTRQRATEVLRKITEQE